jgi:hypothetical protein
MNALIDDEDKEDGIVLLYVIPLAISSALLVSAALTSLLLTLQRLTK